LRASSSPSLDRGSDLLDACPVNETLDDDVGNRDSAGNASADGIIDLKDHGDNRGQVDPKLSGKKLGQCFLRVGNIGASTATALGDSERKRGGRRVGGDSRQSAPVRPGPNGGEADDQTGRSQFMGGTGHMGGGLVSGEGSAL
jgi:hypothetical protein